MSPSAGTGDDGGEEGGGGEVRVRRKGQTGAGFRRRALDGGRNAKKLSVKVVAPIPTSWSSSNEPN